jgi:site-specific recombinase XerD
MKPTDKQVKVWDTATRGFGIRLNGRTKSWIVMYGPKRTLKTLGTYPDKSLADARKEAWGILSAAPAPRTPKTVLEAQEAFLESNYADAKPRTKKEARRLLDKHFAALQTMQLADLTHEDIERQLAKLADRPSEQLHAFRVMRTFLRWCVRVPRRYIPHSPMEGYEAPGHDRRGTRILTDEELTKLWNTCEGSFGAMVKLLILWGTRQGETACLRREWVQDGVLTIPGEFTKNGRTHAIPLCPMATAILGELDERGPYYFPGRWDDETHFQQGSWGKLKKGLDKASGVTGWQLRDIRRTFRSTMPRLGVSRDVAEVLLNHAPAVLDEIYDRYDRLEEKREALSRMEMHIVGLVQLPSPPEAGTVTQ